MRNERPYNYHHLPSHYQDQYTRPLTSPELTSLLSKLPQRAVTKSATSSVRKSGKSWGWTNELHAQSQSGDLPVRYPEDDLRQTPDAMKTNPCKQCGSPYHTAMYHKRKPLQTRTALKTKSELKTRKPMNKIGKVQKQTQAAVDRWKSQQQPTHQGYYYCYICGRPVDYLMAEHPYSKARHPDKRTNQKFEPVCAEHNTLKGSLDIHDFLEKYPQFKATVKKEYLMC